MRPGRAERGGRTEQNTVAQAEDRRGWVHLRLAEGSENQEATGTGRRWWAGKKGVRNLLTTNSGTPLPFQATQKSLRG